MSWHFSRALGADFSLPAYLAGLRSGRSKKTRTAGGSSSPGCGTGSSTRSRSGTMSPHSTGSRGKAPWTSFPGASRARTFLSPTKGVWVSGPESVLACGESLRESSGRFGLDLLLSKTPRCFAPEDWMPSSPMFQQWGMMLSGVCWELGMSGLPTRGTESSFWPTPTTMDTLPARPLKSLIEQNRKEGRENRKAFKNLREAVVHAAKLPRMVPTIIASDYKTASRPGQRKRSINDPAMGVIPAGGTLNPDWAEWLMGFPVGWTALKELETHRFLRWLQLHSEFCQRG